MRGKRAIIAIVVMGLVLGGAWLATRTSGGGSSTVSLLRFDPLSVTELRLSMPDGTVERLLRLDSGYWVIEADGGVWPADESVVRGAMRKLLGMSGEPSDASFETAATLVIESGDREIAKLLMSSTRLAGRGQVEIEANGLSTTALVDGGLLDVFTSSGLRYWREKKALPTLSAGASGILLESGETLIRLGRVRGRWGLTSPFQERCDEARVNATIRSMANLEFDRFVGADEAPSGGAASAVLETELIRSGESLRQRLEVLGAADIGGEHVYISVTLERNGDVWASATAIVAREVLDEIPMDPAWYASRRAVDTVPADVARIWLSKASTPAPAPLLPDPKMDAEVTLERTLDGWTGPNPAAIALYDETADVLLALLCDADAEEVGVELPDQYTPVALVQVGGRNGLPTGVVEIGVARRGEAQIVILRSGSLNRVYTDSPAVGLVDAILRDE